MKSLHNSIIRPDVDVNDMNDVNIKDVFGVYSTYLKNKFIRDDGSIISKGIFQKSVFENCPEFESKLDSYFGKEYFREVIYCILKDIEFIPRCPICHNYNYLRSWTSGFQKYCCKNCISRSQTNNDEWRRYISASLRKKYVNPKLDSIGITKYEKDREDSNYILIYDYCEHHKDNPLRIYFKTLNRLLNNRICLCQQCIQEKYKKLKNEFCCQNRASNYHLRKNLKTNLSREDVRECLINNFDCSDDTFMGDGYSADYHVTMQLLEIYIDYRYDKSMTIAANSTAFIEAKRKYAEEHGILFLELYSCVDENDILRQIDFIVNAAKCCPIDVSYFKLLTEYEHYKSLKCNSSISDYKINALNAIVRYFQYDQFYAKELHMYAYNPVVRRKLIQNCCKYLSKNESELTFSELLSGFKKSGIYYGYSHFNPCWTSWFVNKYGIKSIYDPCGGWGHHMLGMLSCERIIYNDINPDVCRNVERMKEIFEIDVLEVHNEDSRIFIPDDVDAFFMCPPYMNLEKYLNRFKNVKEFIEMLNKIFDIWKKNKARFFSIILREDFFKMISNLYVPKETYEVFMGESHFVKNRKRFKENMYIFDKNTIEKEYD